VAVEFASEDLFPPAEVEPALPDGNDHLAAHHLPFPVCVGIVLAGRVVPKPGRR
jgi:hypothetical protein